MDDTTFQIPCETTVNEYRASAAVACELVAAIQYARATSLHEGLDATAIETLQGNVDTINCWMAVPTEDGSNGPERPAEVVTIAAVRPQGNASHDSSLCISFNFSNTRSLNFICVAIAWFAVSVMRNFSLPMYNHHLFFGFFPLASTMN